MGFDDLKIRDLSRLSGEWTPPIGVMGGPPAHELYADLVVHAGLQLFRDGRSRPWVVLRDGAQRRAFQVPSSELRSALDRFRMRRNLRPVPEGDIEEFARVVEARISDPDVQIPLLKSPVAEETPSSRSDPPSAGEGPGPETRWKNLEDRIDSALRGLDELDRPAPSTQVTPESPPVRGVPVSGPLSWETEGSGVESSVSGGRGLPRPDDATFGRYVRVLRTLVHDGSWMGTTEELARLTQDDPLTMFDALLRYRTGLAEQNILIANIELGDEYRWLAVNRSTIRGSSGSRPPAIPPLPAQ